MSFLFGMIGFSLALSILRASNKHNIQRIIEGPPPHTLCAGIKTVLYYEFSQQGLLAIIVQVGFLLGLYL